MAQTVEELAQGSTVEALNQGEAMDEEEEVSRHGASPHDEDVSLQGAIIEAPPASGEDDNQASHSDPLTAEPMDALDSDSLHDLFGFNVEDFVVPLDAGSQVLGHQLLKCLPIWS